MRLAITLKGRLIGLVGLALLGLCALAGLGIGANEANRVALSSLYERDIDALVRLQRVENILLEVRFRAAAVLLDQLPIQGSANHLRDSRKLLSEHWSSVSVRSEEAFAQGGGREEFSQIKQKWGIVDATLAKLEQGYASKNKTLLTAVLEDEWPVLHKEAIKPLQALIPHTQKASAATYEAAHLRSRFVLVVGVGVSVLCLLALLVTAWRTMRAILVPLRDVERTIGQFAVGDLTAAMPPARRDELGGIVAALSTMHRQLVLVVGSIRASAQSIETACVEVASGNQDLSARTEHAASNLQQTASSIEQLTGAVQQSATSAQQARQLAADAAEVALRGGTAVSQVVSTMDEINGSARRIADISGVIDGIAFQTNILALNAAVEAARAGEQGRGFAVVASEVRNLAQRSASAAREIKALIGASVDRVDAGSRLVAQAGATMNEIVSSVERVTAVIGDITGASGEQAKGIGQVNAAVAQLDQMTQQNAALVEQSAASAESLREQAQRLTQMVQTFKLVPALP